MSQSNLRSWKFFVAGVQHHNLKKCIDEMKEGDYLSLIPEPTNKYDTNAVRIEFIYQTIEGSIENIDGVEEEVDAEYDEVMIGYVPAKLSPMVTAAIITSKVTCQITKLDKQAKAWERIKVKIEEVKDNA
ncbi:MAG: HIRAN domain-containing protein [Gammaproteobacteria bacterium]|uniref:Putative HIRAN domain containing protein n=1 Tax=viral metagenome TaxID=1070528 RepID=A0A6M3IT80_9ZZZZ|nr:HIRAN domain-containing protein [Gammaproteobacteria bacterium]